jgi:hypothetical protein
LLKLIECIKYKITFEAIRSSLKANIKALILLN